MTRVLASVAVAVLVVLAGCGGAPATETTADAPDETTAEPTTVNGDGPQRVTVPSSLVAPGGNQRAITDAQALLQAHLGELARTRYRSSATHTKLYTAGNYDTTGESTYEITAGNSTFTTTRETVENGSTEVEAVYSTESAAFVRSANATATTYRYGAGPVPLRLQQYARPQHPSASLMFVYSELASGMQATGFATRNGEKVVRYEAAGATTSKLSRYGSVLGAPNGTVEDLSLTMYVDTDGVVHEATGSMTLVRQNGETRDRSLSFELTAIGEAEPTEPAWTSSVPQLEGSLNADNDLLTLENVGSASLKDYDLTVSDTVVVQRGNVSAEASADGALAPGDSLYLYVTGSGNDTVLHVSETRPDVPADARELTRNGRSYVYVGSPNATVDVGVFRNTTETNESVAATDDVAPTPLRSAAPAASPGDVFLGARTAGLRA